MKKNTTHWRKKRKKRRLSSIMKSLFSKMKIKKEKLNATSTTMNWLIEKLSVNL